MDFTFARQLTGRKRSTRANRQLGFTLAFVAGAINAGGFLAVKQYTSHMTGIVSSMADYLVLGIPDVFFSGLGALLSFMFGAAASAMLINHARRHRRHSEYAFPLLLEAGLLLCFGILGTQLSTIEGLFVPATVMLLCFMMGLQNAVITKISRAEIRTTHVTGIVTDLGIELGKLAYHNGPGAPRHMRVVANRERLVVLSSMLGAFFLGGVVGAAGFKHVGYLSTVPLAIVLVALSFTPAVDDAVVFYRRISRGRARRRLKAGTNGNSGKHTQLLVRNRD